MNKMKSLLLGSAVGLLGVSGAVAADLPVAEPVEYVKVCETYGPGFLYIPGTDTCLKVGGYVRFQTIAHTGEIADDAWFGNPFKITGNDDNNNDTYNMYVRGLVNFDARTETSYGTLRSFIQIRASALDQDSATVELDLAFLQFAGFTAGLAPSILDFATNGFFGDQIGDWNHDTVQLAYTAQFGGGVSLTAGVQSGEREQTELDGYDPIDGTYADTSRTEMPDVAAALRVNQGWGEAMIGGLVRQVQGFDGDVANPAFDPDDPNEVDPATLGASADGEIGWAVNAGLKVNLPMIAKGDHIILRAAYGEGASRSVANFALPDGSFLLDEGAIETAKLWSLYGGYTHYWTDTVRSNLVASYAAGTFDLGENDEFSALTASANVIWSPVKNLDVGLEVLYSSVDIDDGLSVGKADASSDDGFGAIFRIQRNFGN